MTADLYVEGNTLLWGSRSFTCAVGKGGFAHMGAKKEGDGKTPCGVFPMRGCWYRADRLNRPATGLALKMIGEYDGWCDDPRHLSYNLPVLLPFIGSHEKMWREDHVYDLVIPLGYNDRPIVRGKGSAIFLHVATPDYAPTEGCVALAKDDLLEILVQLSPASLIHIASR